jgi:hypothetical protein
MGVGGLRPGAFTGRGRIRRRANDKGGTFQ